MESKIKDLRQQIFKFKNNNDFNKSDFFVSQSNFFAYNLLNSWPKWEKKLINVFGEKKSGKSHLTNIFLEDKGGIKILSKNLDFNFLDNLKNYENIVLEDFEPNCDEKLVYSLLDLVEKNNKYLILTSCKAVNTMNFNLNDLKSRLKNCLIAEMTNPDDDLVYALLIKNLSDNQLVLDNKIINFIIQRIPRSYGKISDFICTIDEISLKKKKPINLKIIKELLRT